MTHRLLANNLRWAATKSQTDYFQALAGRSAPKLFWLGCSDCRVPAHDIVGLAAGEVFVHRNLANQADSRDGGFVAALQYALDACGIEEIVVCGHYGCAAVESTLSGDGGAHIDQWLQPLHTLAGGRETQAVRDHDARAHVLCEANVAEQVRRIADNPLVRAIWRRGRPLAVHGWVLSASDGLLRDLGVSVRSGQEVTRRGDTRGPRRAPRRRA